MQASIDFTSGAQFVAESGSGHSIVVDGPPDIGGRNTGMRPMELMLLSVASCSAMDVIHILRKSRQAFVGCRVEVDGTRAETDPKVFTHIHLKFIVSGDSLDEKRVSRAVSLSAEKYCSASLMLQESVEISHEYEICSQASTG